MSPERKFKRPSKGEAIHRRKILAETRRRVVFSVDEKIIDKEQAAARLTEVNTLLDLENLGLSVFTPQELEQTRAGLEIEQIWIRYKLGIISSVEEKNRLLQTKFNELEQTKPGTYQWLTSRDDRGLSMAERIRDKVMPPIRVAGFHTKR